MNDKIIRQLGLAVLAAVSITGATVATAQSTPEQRPHADAMRAFNTELQTAKNLKARIEAARRLIATNRDSWSKKTLWITTILTADLALQHTEPQVAVELYDSVLTELETANDASTSPSANLGLGAAERAEIEGRALYGKGRSLEAADGKELLVAARKAYSETIRRRPHSRYARFAAIADERLKRSPTLALGRAMPALTFGPDELHGPVQREDLAKRAHLLVFWSSDDAASLRAGRELARIWSRSGQPEAQCVLMGMGSNAAEKMRTAAPSRAFRAIAVEDGFRSENAAILGLTRTPSSFLVGADGKLLARDLSPARLRRLLSRASNPQSSSPSAGPKTTGGD